MIYDSLDNLPIVLYYRILENDYNVNLLNPKNLPIELKTLKDIWLKIHDDFQKLEDNKLSQKILLLTVNCNSYILKYEAINRCVDSLLFSFNEELISILKENGFKISKENYLEDLNQIKINSQGYLIKAEHFKSKLPKENTSKNGEKIRIEDILASYSSVLGYSIGNFINVTCSEFIAYKKQVEIKLKSQEKQLSDLKKNTRK